MAHNCHGNNKYLTAKLKLSRQYQIPHGKTKMLTAKPKCSRQNHKAHGKTKNSRRNRKAHGKNKKLTAKPKSSRQKPEKGNNYIDDMTKKWLSQTPNPPRIPEFYTVTKIHKPTLVGRPIISGCNGPTERISAFVDTLLLPVSTSQTSYLKDSTNFINFIET